MNEEMTLGKWLLTLLILCVPCVNIVMLFIWAFGNGAYPSRKTFAQAYLIFTVILVVLYFVFMLLFGASFAALMGSMAEYSLIMF